MEDISTIMDFNKSIIRSGITGEKPTAAEIEEAKTAAKNLKSKGVFSFDLENDSSFMRSVAKFANSFR